MEFSSVGRIELILIVSDSDGEDASTVRFDSLASFPSAAIESVDFSKISNVLLDAILSKIDDIKRVQQTSDEFVDYKAFPLYDEMKGYKKVQWWDKQGRRCTRWELLDEEKSH